MAKETQSITYKSMGGMRTDLPINSLPEDVALVAKNCRLDDFPEVNRRMGFEKYNTTQYTGAGNITGLYDFRYGSSSKFIVATSTKIYTDDQTTQSEIKSGMTSGSYYNFSTFDNFLWICNGTDRVLKYDGTTVTNASLTVPSVGTFAAADSGSVGNVTGTVKYLVTFYVTSTGQESNPFTLANAASVSVVNKIVNLTAIPVSSDTQVTARKIYRTTSGGSEYSAQYLVTISDNTTTTYADNILDANLGELIELDHDPAPTLKKMIIHKNRAFGITGIDSRVYFTKALNVWYWPQGITDLSATASQFYFDIDPDNGDTVSNIITYYDYILIFKNNSVYVLGGYDESDFFIRKIDYEINVGCISFRGSVVAGNWCYFLDRNGIYRTNAQIIEYVGEPMESFFDPDNSASDLKVNQAQLTNAVMIVDQRKPRNLIRVSLPSGDNTVNDLTLIYYWTKNMWTYDTGYIAQSYAVRCVNNEDYLIRGDNYGFVLEEEQQNGDGGLIYSTATSGTANTLTDTAQSMTVDLYKGAYVDILSGTGAGDRLKIISNTATTITIDGNFSATPDTTSIYTIGGIDFEYIHGWRDYGDSAFTKRLKYVRPWIDGDGDYNVTAYVWYDFEQARTETLTLNIDAQPLWDVAVWDVDEWDSEVVINDLIRTESNKIHVYVAFGIAHKPAGQSVALKGYNLYFQTKGLGLR